MKRIFTLLFFALGVSAISAQNNSQADATEITVTTPTWMFPVSRLSVFRKIQ